MRINFPVPEITPRVREELGEWPIIIPSGTARSGTWIADEYRNALLLHVAKNYVSDLNPPLILAIQGGTGEGKSFQSREVFSHLGVYVVPVSGALLGGAHEGEAVEVLRKAYAFASSVRGSVKRMTALLVDDFDMSVASVFDGRRYTVNTQLLTGFLMNLADDPTRCRDEATYRIPLVITGNDFTALHLPLTRHGRMNFFTWKPTLEQKQRVVAAIFNQVVAPGEAARLDDLVSTYAHQPISFFASLKEDMVDEAILETVDRERAINPTSVSHAASEALRHMPFDVLERLAERRQLSVARSCIGSGVYESER